jgi:CHAD domain-containing protein
MISRQSEFEWCHGRLFLGVLNHSMVGMRNKPGIRRDPIREYASDLVARLVEVLYENFDKLEAEENVEFLHDMRVASRRLREALVFFSFLQDGAKLRKAVGRIRGITRTVGQSREMDVNLELLNKFPPPADPGIEVTREHFLELFALERERIRKRMDKGLKEMKLKERKTGFLKAARGFLLEPAAPAHTNDGPVVASLDDISERAEATIRSRLSSLEEFDGIDAVPQNDKALHRLRVRVKKFRYTLEICDPLYENRFAPALNLAKELQDLLGKIHDYGVLIDRLSHQRVSLEENKRWHLLEGSGIIIRHLEDSKSTFYPQFRPAYEAFVKEVSSCISAEDALLPCHSTQAATQPETPNPFIDF